MAGLLFVIKQKRHRNDVSFVNIKLIGGIMPSQFKLVISKRTMTL
uniref:Uncharacterized protein n=1 Tax=Siphoviridae sp. ctL0q1 TaxID=2825449 RepID=A0A8S5PK10_9CAUD|nr:MAG TPA: hypothetical protein [Siphoviridae sp. ctL0q1]